MNYPEFQLRVLGDPRLAVYVTSALPAWLWSIDGKRVLWANPVGTNLFAAANVAELIGKTFGPADQHRRQVVQLAKTLPAGGTLRLQRLRGFGARLGALVTCGCSRLEFADGTHAVMIAATELSGRGMPLVERLRRLVDGVTLPIATFTREGIFVSANEQARTLLGFRDLSEAGLEEARNSALALGRVEMAIGTCSLVLQRVGTRADVGFIAFIQPHRAQSSPTGREEGSPQARALPTDSRTPEHEDMMQTGETPAEFASIDEVADTHSIGDEIGLRSATSASEAGPNDRPLQRPLHVEALEDQPPTIARADQTMRGLSAAETSTGEGVPPEPNNRSRPMTHSWLEELSQPRHHPLRFMWRMSDDGRFSLESDEFVGLLGPEAAAHLGRPWNELASTLGLDPQGRVAKAIATNDTWMGISLRWPVDGGEQLPIELSGLPVLDRAGKLAGYCGFGVCRDLDALTRVAALRRYESSFGVPASKPPSAAMVEPREGQDEAPADTLADPNASSSIAPERPDAATAAPEQFEPENRVDTPPNVVPLRPAGEQKLPMLTANENNAFHELARQLSERLEIRLAGATASSQTTNPNELSTEPPPEGAESPPEWLLRPEPPARADSQRDRALLDLLPTGVLIYRLDRLLYANPAFLDSIGYHSLHALEEAGGLDALYVEPGVSSASSTSETGTPVTISSAAGAHKTSSSGIGGRLHTISWDGDSALALIFSQANGAPASVPTQEVIPQAAPSASAPAQVHVEAEDLAAVLDTTAEGILMFDAGGNIKACNRSAEALFGYDDQELVARDLMDLFAPESHRAVQDYLTSIREADPGSLLEHGREVLARVSKGGIIPLSMTMGRTRPDGPNLFAVFRDLSHTRKGESELHEARRLAERASAAKADLIARISHDVRIPLNAIIGFAEIMIGERFGSLGNERYIEYLKDIRASGERVFGVINDLLEMSLIETGKVDLCLSKQNLNDLVENCVATMQPQANRERIIIRTSLSRALPSIVADARALRQITLNLIGNSIHLAKCGGQVIVSTALTDRGEVALRVRDTGHAMSENEVAAALEPFHTPPPLDQVSDSTAVTLSLTKALVEANRAQFQIKTGGRSGTLIEVVFAGERRA